MTAPVVARQSDSAPDSAKVFDLYAAGSRRAPAGAAPTEKDAYRETQVGDVAASVGLARPPTVTLAELLEAPTGVGAGMDPVWPQGLYLIQRVLSCVEQASAGDVSSSRHGETGTGFELESPRRSWTPVSLDASRIEVDATGTVRVLDDIEDGPHAVQIVTTWLYRFAAGRYPARKNRQRPSRFNRNLPKWVDGVCTKGSQNDAANHYPNLRALANDLREHAPPPSRLDVSKWVIHVLRSQQPTEVELAGELGDALTQFTYSTTPTRWLTWLGCLLALSMTLGVAAWFVYEASLG